MSKLTPHLEALNSGLDLDAGEAAEVFDLLISESDVDKLVVFLKVWNQKGQSPGEIAACAQIMRNRAVKVRSKRKDLVDIVGTGGSTAKMFNVSTAAALVAAGAGVPIAKHGNRAASSQTGSADALSHLGVNVVAEPARAERCLDRHGICFMFAPKFHNLTAELAKARRSVGKPTIFNLLGPIANPASANFQLIGVWQESLLKPMAEAVSALNTRKTWIVHGSDGLDEITTGGVTSVAEVTAEGASFFEISPHDFGVGKSDLSEFKNVTPEISARIIRGILNGDRSSANARDIVVLNAAAAIFISGRADDYPGAAKMAANSIDTGAASEKLNALITETNT